MSCIMGNEYNFLALLNHPCRFDFYLPARPDLPTDENAELLPVSLVEDLMRARMEKFELYLSALSLLSNCQIIYVPPPPPIVQAAYIEAHPALFAKRLKRFGVSPAPSRLKMWLLNCEIQRQLCERAGVILYPLPEVIFILEGFLAEPYWNEDPTHGNAAYGKVVLDEISRTRFSQLSE